MSFKCVTSQIADKSINQSIKFIWCGQWPNQLTIVIVAEYKLHIGMCNQHQIADKW
jgi:hypothetical protein